MLVFTCGVFDLFHAGHKELLENMQEVGDRVVVLLHDDKSTYANKERFPVQDYEHRRRNLLATGLVDDILMVDEADPSDSFKWFLHKKDNVIFMRGDDWQDFPGKQVLEERKVEIRLKKYKEDISSTKLRSEL